MVKNWLGVEASVFVDICDVSASTMVNIKLPK